MLQRLVYQSTFDEPSRILDLGCGTGWFTRKLRHLYPDSEISGVDLSPEMVRHARTLSDPDINWLIADAASLPLAGAGFDLIFSNLMIQWCDNPADVLRECCRLLKPGGRLAVSTLTDGTLRELQQAWHKADPEGIHVNRFVPTASLLALAKAVLPGVVADVRTVQLPSRSPMALISELKSLGAGFKGPERRKTITAPGRLREMCRHYPREPGGEVIASYQTVWLYWHKQD
jgi:malonyl-CoA O-methyltransferase